MKIEIITPKNYYSCTQCTILFNSRNELILLWFCSGSCKYRFAYDLCKQTFPLADNKKIFQLTKRVLEVCL